MKAIRIVCCALLLAGCVTFLGQGPRVSAAVPTQLREEFNRRYERWTAWCEAHKFSSTMTSCQEYGDIIALGPQATPLIVELLAADPEMKTRAFHLTHALSQITKRRILREEYPDETPGGSQQHAKLMLKWWQEGRRTTRADFEQRYAAFKATLAKATPLMGHYYPLKSTLVTYTTIDKRIVNLSNRDITEAGKAYQRLEAMGIDILPLIVEQLRAGNADLLPVVDTLTDGKGVLQPRVEQHMELTGTLKERVAFTLAWWDEQKEDWLLPPASQQE